MSKKIYIGIDPDLRLLNAAIVTYDKRPLQVFARRNPLGIDGQAVVNASRAACRLIEDVISYFVVHEELSQCETVLVIEDQNMMHVKKMREKGKKINYKDIKTLAQVTGCLMGAFSNMSNSSYLVQAIDWKGTLPKDISHERYYTALGLESDETKKLKNIYPKSLKALSEWSHDKINPGDFMDINDSLGLALYGAKKGLI